VTEEIVAAIAVGFMAGVSSGLLGIGGGALFVPALIFLLGLSQIDAEATSLVAIVPTAIVGAMRQRSYGNLNLRDGLLIGLLALPAAVGGSVLAEALGERLLELLFAALQAVVAIGLARRAMAPERVDDAPRV
jgi:uncharacterized membrane protein YfcA